MTGATEGILCAVQFSPDGQWFWDGTQWRAAYSPDRRWRWDGVRWVPLGPPPMQRWRYEPTEWTRRLQVILLVLMVVGGLVGIALIPAFVLPTMQRTLDTVLATMPPDPNIDAQSFRDAMSAEFNASLVSGGVLGVGLLALSIVGIVRLWRWVYWYLCASFLIAPLGILQNAAMLATGVGPITVPGWVLLYSIPLSLAEAALGIWMIVLYRRYGTWARRRLPVT
jgi:hypothetical protein